MRRSITSRGANIAQRRTRQFDVFQNAEALALGSLGRRYKPTVSSAGKKFSTVSATDPKFGAMQPMEKMGLEFQVPKSKDTLKTLSTVAGELTVPHDLRGYVFDESERSELLGLRTPNLSHGDPEAFRAEVKTYFNNTFTTFEKLHEIFVRPASFFTKHERLRHPPIFYVGHTASFYVNKFNLGKFMDQRIDTELEMQTAVGVDEMSWDDWDSNSYAWPSGEEAEADPEHARQFLNRVMGLRADVRKLVNQQIDTQPAPQFPINKDSFWWILLMGIEHENIHLETSSCILRQAEPHHVQSHPF